MAGVKRSQFTESMKKDSYGYFWDKYTDVGAKAPELFEIVQSDAAYEKFTSAIGLGELLEKPEGEDMKTDAPMESYTIVCKNRSFGRIVRMSYETVQDSKKISNMLSETVGTWGRQLPITKEKFYAKFFNRGAYTAGDDVFNNTISQVVDDSTTTSIYDSTVFFNTAHPDKVGNTYSNYNSSRSLTHANLKTTYEQFTITNAYDERGDVIELMPDTLLMPPNLSFTAQEILETTLIPGSQDNDVNVLKTIVSPMSWRYLTDTDGWFLLKRQMGLMGTDREDVTLDFWQDETSKDYFASVFTRFGGCVTNFRGAIANNTGTS